MATPSLRSRASFWEALNLRIFIEMAGYEVILPNLMQRRGRLRRERNTNLVVSIAYYR